VNPPAPNSARFASCPLVNKVFAAICKANATRIFALGPGFLAGVRLLAAPGFYFLTFAYGTTSCARWRNWSVRFPRSVFVLDHLGKTGRGGGKQNRPHGQRISSHFRRYRNVLLQDFRPSRTEGGLEQLAARPI